MGLITNPGFHHVCLQVESVPATYKKMAADGVEFFFAPKFRGKPKENVTGFSPKIRTEI